MSPEKSYINYEVQHVNSRDGSYKTVNDRALNVINLPLLKPGKRGPMRQCQM